METSIEKLASLNAAFIITSQQLLEFADYILSQQAGKYLEIMERANANRMLSVKETKAMLNKSTKTLWEWARRGYLVPFKVGRTSYYKMSDVLDMIRERNPDLLPPKMSNEVGVNFGQEL